MLLFVRRVSCVNTYVIIACTWYSHVLGVLLPVEYSRVLENVLLFYGLPVVRILQYWYSDTLYQVL
jgi:hypothetical protein